MMVTVPGVVGVTQDAATEKLEDKGFVVEVTHEAGSAAEPNTVLRQSPHPPRS